MNLVAAFFVGLAVFLIVWAVGEVWMSRRPVWRPSPPGPGIQHGEYVPFIPPPGEWTGDYPGVRRADHTEDRCRDLSCTCNLDRTS